MYPRSERDQGKPPWGTGTKALTSSLIRPARSSKPWSMGLRIGGQLPTYGRLRAGGTRAKGERMEGGEYACPFFFESIFFDVLFTSTLDTITNPPL